MSHADCAALRCPHGSMQLLCVSATGGRLELFSGRYVPSVSGMSHGTTSMFGAALGVSFTRC